MTRITNVDQVMLLLQARLENKKRAEKKSASNSQVERPKGNKDAVARVKDISQDESLSESDVHRALIRGILTNEFGASVANDASFQKVIDDVLTVIQSDDMGKNLLGDSIKML